MHNNGRMLGVIGGSGFYTFFGSDTRTVNSDTPYGQPSAPITIGTIGVHDVAFLPRHGAHHQYSAHAVPYRANMWALRALGVGIAQTGAVADQQGQIAGLGRAGRQ